MDLSALTDDQVYQIKEDLEYRRKSTKSSFKNGKVESSDVALDAPLWLLEQVCTKVECQNGGPDREILSKDDIQKIPTRTKLRVIGQHLAELEGEEAEQVKN
jgi:hypothetical protein